MRIIGGAWRRRRLPVPEAKGLRPTPDRVKETLFNWLSTSMEGARCLDLYAGSGSLGLEAASRGAARVVMVENDPRLVEKLRRQCEALGASGVQVVQASAESWLRRIAEPFDVVFLDPPFADPPFETVTLALAQGGWLAPGARMYLESHLSAGRLGLPDGWTVLRSEKAGQVRYHLASAQEFPARSTTAP